jgi:hypothetical protein
MKNLRGEQDPAKQGLEIPVGAEMLFCRTGLNSNREISSCFTEAEKSNQGDVEEVKAC